MLPVTALQSTENLLTSGERLQTKLKNLALLLVFCFSKLRLFVQRLRASLLAS